MNDMFSDMGTLIANWIGRLPGGVELCVACETPLEVMPYQWHTGAYRYRMVDLDRYMVEPALLCDDCAVRECPEVLASWEEVHVCAARECPEEDGEDDGAVELTWDGTWYTHPDDESEPAS